MLVHLVSVLFGLHLMAIDLVVSDILCEDSRIDSITYANDLQMYFLTSGGYYWWLKESDFPPPDDKAARLPAPFKMGHSAVYVDSDSGCASARSAEGIKSGEKEVWVEEYVGGQHILMAFDTKRGVWRENTIVYNKDHCISRARIDWATGKPLDAMFVRNYLEIFFIQENTYSMVDCNFICTDPNLYGEDKPQYKTTDFHTVDTIYAMFVKKNKQLFMFHQKTYYEMSIQPNSRNGKLVTIKGIKEMNTIRDFLKISNPGQCVGPKSEAPPPIEKQDKPSPNEEGREEQPPPAVGGSEDQNKSDDSGESGGSGSGWSIFIIVAVVMIVVLIIAVLAFFAIKSSTGEANDKEKAEKQKTSAVKPGTQSPNKASGPSKAGAQGLGAKKGQSAIQDKSSTVTNKSNIGVVGIASKSIPSSKSSTKK